MAPPITLATWLYIGGGVAFFFLTLALAEVCERLQRSGQ